MFVSAPTRMGALGLDIGEELADAYMPLWPSRVLVGEKEIVRIAAELPQDVGGVNSFRAHRLSPQCTAMWD